eukprot:g65293.t1
MDRQALLNLLSLTCSEDAEQRRTAERALLLGDRRGGADFRIDRQLLTLAFDKSLSLGMRLAAAIRLKQNLQTRTEREGIPSEDEEGELRQIQACLLQQLQPLPASLKKQLALCITTLALKRWPQQWPDLLPALATNITQKGASTEVCLYVLQKLLKTLRPIQFYSSSSGFNSSGLSKPGPLRVDVEEKRTGKGGKILPRTSPEQRRALLAYVQQSLLALCFNQWKLCTGVLLRALSQEASSDSKGGGLSAKHAAEQGALGLLQLRLTKCTVHCVLLTLPTLQEASAPLRMVLHDMAQSLRSLAQVQASLAQVQARLSPEHVVAGSLTRCTLRTARLFKLTIKEFPQLLVGSVQKLGALFLEILNHSFQPGHLRFCFEALTVQALLFFLDLCQLRFEAITEGLPLDSFSSSNEPSSPGLDSARQLSPRAQLVVELRTFLTAALVLDLIQLLVTQFFVLTAADLQAWQSDPEGLVFSEARLALDEKARPGAELLFWQLLNMSERETVIGYLLRLFQKHVGDCPPGNPPATAAPLCSLQQAIAQHGRAWPTPTIPRAILAKDALYSAVGLGSMQLAAAISAISKDGSPPTTREAGHMSSDSSAGPAALSFSNWYKQVLHQELRDLTPGREVLRRRAVWVLGEWADQITDELRPSVYTNVAGLIQDPDQVVQLTAALALKQIIFPHDFMSSFHLVEPHLNALTLGLCDLTIKVKSLQTRDSLLQVLQSLVRTCGPRIAAVLGVFVQRFPHLWTACEQKNEALDLLGAMLRALSSHAIPLYPFLRTVLHFCLQPSTQPERTYLIPLALELYQTTLQHCPLQLPSLTFSSTAASSIFTAGANAPRKRSGGKGGSMSTGGCIVPGCGAPVFKKFHCAEHLSASRGQAYSPASPHTSPQNEHGGMVHRIVVRISHTPCFSHYFPTPPYALFLILFPTSIRLVSHTISHTSIRLVSHTISHTSIRLVSHTISHTSIRLVSHTISHTSIRLVSHTISHTSIRLVSHTISRTSIPLVSHTISPHVHTPCFSYCFPTPPYALFLILFPHTSIRLVSHTFSHTSIRLVSHTISHTSIRLVSHTISHTSIRLVSHTISHTSIRLVSHTVSPHLHTPCFSYYFPTPPYALFLILFPTPPYALFLTISHTSIRLVSHTISPHLYTPCFSYYFPTPPYALFLILFPTPQYALFLILFPAPPYALFLVLFPHTSIRLVSHTISPHLYTPCFSYYFPTPLYALFLILFPTPQYALFLILFPAPPYALFLVLFPHTSIRLVSHTVSPHLHTPCFSYYFPTPPYALFLILFPTPPYTLFLILFPHTSIPITRLFLILFPHTSIRSHDIRLVSHTISHTSMRSHHTPCFSHYFPTPPYVAMTYALFLILFPHTSIRSHHKPCFSYYFPTPPYVAITSLVSHTISPHLHT